MVKLNSKGITLGMQIRTSIMPLLESLRLSHNAIVTYGALFALH